MQKYAMSKKATLFLIELEALCKKHKVQLSTSEYDGLQLWDLTESNKDEPIYCNGIEDKTHPEV